MKQMKATKRTTKVVSLLLTLCLVISMFSVTAYGDDTAINKQLSTDSTESTLLEGKKLFKTLESNIYQNSHEEQKYVEDEVLIGIADNETTRSMSFCAVYSDDYQTINKNEKERNLNSVAAEPVETIKRR